MVLGLGTVIYPVANIESAKSWYATAFRQEPYFVESYYVGFNIAGYELGLDPNSPHTSLGPGGGVAYWRVTDIEMVVQHFVTHGAKVIAPVQDVGGDVRVATLADPFGNSLGFIQNPHFQLPK